MKKFLQIAGLGILVFLVFIYNLNLKSYFESDNVNSIVEPTINLVPTEEVSIDSTIESDVYTLPAKAPVHYVTPIMKQKTVVQNVTPSNNPQQTSEKNVSTQYNPQQDYYPSTSTKVDDQYSKKQTCNDNAWSTKSACDWDCSNYPLTVESCKQQCNENFRLSKLSCDSL